MIWEKIVTYIKWILFALFISFVLVIFFEGTVEDNSIILKTQNTFFGLNLFLEILIFIAFSSFVVFSIKGFFDFYSQKVSNGIVLVSGSLLILVISMLCYQVLFQE